MNSFRNSPGIIKVSAQDDFDRENVSNNDWYLVFLRESCQACNNRILLAVINCWKSSQKHRGQNKSQFDYQVIVVADFPHTFNRKTLSGVSGYSMRGDKDFPLKCLTPWEIFDEGTRRSEAICVIAPRKPVELAYKRIKCFLALGWISRRDAPNSSDDRKRFLPRFLPASLFNYCVKFTTL